MTRKAILLIFLMVMIAAAMIMPKSVSAQNSANCGRGSLETLHAGQTINAGRVLVTNDENNLYITYTTSGGWLLQEAHVHVATSLAGIPQNNEGIPVPGQFMLQNTFNPPASTYQYTIPLSWSSGTEIYVVAHATLTNGYTSETAFGGDEVGAGSRWWYYSRYTIQACDRQDEPDPETPDLDGEGCTPGYWRQSQHYDDWAYNPDDSFEAVFGRDVIAGSGDLQLGDAVRLNGGDVNALIRHSVAALLNSVNTEVDYPFTTGMVIAMFQSAYDSGNYEATKDSFDEANNLGCPLGNGRGDNDDDDGNGRGNGNGNGNDDDDDDERGNGRGNGNDDDDDERGNGNGRGNGNANGNGRGNGNGNGNGN